MTVSPTRLPLSLPAPASLATPGRLLIVVSLALTLNLASPWLANGPASGEASPVSRALPAEVGVNLTSPAFGFYGDSSCLTGATASQPVSQQVLSSGVAPGLRDLGNGLMRRCQRHGWLIPPPTGGAPTQAGRVILVSISQQWLWAYQDQEMVYANPATSGKPGLNTPTGTYQVLSRESNVMFYSPWGPRSPNYYAPQHVNYALLFRVGGFYIHDAPWRAMFGPGTNMPHLVSGGQVESGSHGCVNVTTRTAQWLYSWALPGTEVIIVA